MVLEVDPDKRRISLGLKQTLPIRGKRSPRSSRSARPSKAKSRTRPSSACSSASTAMSTAWSTSPTSTGRSRASKRSRTTTVATWSRPRCSTSMSRRSASRSASSSSRPATADGATALPRRRLKKGSVVTGTVTEVNDGGIEVRIADTDMTAFIRRADLSPRPQRPAPGAFRQGREGRRARHHGRPEDRQDRALDQGAGNRRREGSRRRIRLVGLGRLARRHPRRGAQGPREEARR